MQPARELELIDLRAQRDEPLLASFVRLYEHIFSDPKQRENPKLWPPRLWGEAPAPEPLLHVLVARSAAGALLGGAACEYYRESSCGLLTYLLVAEQPLGKSSAQKEQLLQATSHSGANIKWWTSSCDLSPNSSCKEQGPCAPWKV